MRNPLDTSFYHYAYTHDLLTDAPAEAAAPHRATRIIQRANNFAWDHFDQEQNGEEVSALYKDNLAKSLIEALAVEANRHETIAPLLNAPLTYHHFRTEILPRFASNHHIPSKQLRTIFPLLLGYPLDLKPENVVKNLESGECTTPDFLHWLLARNGYDYGTQATAHSIAELHNNAKFEPEFLGIMQPETSRVAISQDGMRQFLLALDLNWSQTSRAMHRITAWLDSKGATLNDIANKPLYFGPKKPTHTMTIAVPSPAHEETPMLNTLNPKTKLGQAFKLLEKNTQDNFNITQPPTPQQTALHYFFNTAISMTDKDIKLPENITPSYYFEHLRSVGLPITNTSLDKLDLLVAGYPSTLSRLEIQRKNKEPEIFQLEFRFSLTTRGYDYGTAETAEKLAQNAEDPSLKAAVLTLMADEKNSLIEQETLNKILAAAGINQTFHGVFSGHYRASRNALFSDPDKPASRTKQGSKHDFLEELLKRPTAPETPELPPRTIRVNAEDKSAFLNNTLSLSGLLSNVAKEHAKGDINTLFEQCVQESKIYGYDTSEWPEFDLIRLRGKDSKSTGKMPYKEPQIQALAEYLGIEQKLFLQAYKKHTLGMTLGTDYGIGFNFG